MEPIKWHPFDKAKGYRQKRPPIKKYVLVLMQPKSERVVLVHGDNALVSRDPCGIAVGYRKDSAGDKSCPYFVVPGLHTGKVIAWADVLPNDLKWPMELVTEHEVS